MPVFKASSSQKNVLPSSVAASDLRIKKYYAPRLFPAGFVVGRVFGPFYASIAGLFLCRYSVFSPFFSWVGLFLHPYPPSPTRDRGWPARHFLPHSCPPAGFTPHRISAFRRCFSFAPCIFFGLVLNTPPIFSRNIQNPHCKDVLKHCSLYFFPSPSLVVREKPLFFNFSFLDVYELNSPLFHSHRIRPRQKSIPLFSQSPGERAAPLADPETTHSFFPLQSRRGPLLLDDSSHGILSYPPLDESYTPLCPLTKKRPSFSVIPNAFPKATTQTTPLRHSLLVVRRTALLYATVPLQDTL